MKLTSVVLVGAVSLSAVERMEKGPTPTMRDVTNCARCADETEFAAG